MWCADKVQTVKEFRDDIVKATSNYGTKATSKHWCTLIVIQDISDNIINYAHLCHIEYEDTVGHMANLLFFDDSKEAQ